MSQSNGTTPLPPLAARLGDPHDTPPATATPTSEGRSRFGAESAMGLLVENLKDRLLFAVPKKGRLHEKCLELLAGELNFGLESSEMGEIWGLVEAGERWVGLLKEMQDSDLEALKESRGWQSWPGTATKLPEPGIRGLNGKARGQDDARV